MPLRRCSLGPGLRVAAVLARGARQARAHAPLKPVEHDVGLLYTEVPHGGCSILGGSWVISRVCVVKPILGDL